MAAIAHITAADHWFTGEKKIHRFTETAAVDMDGWALSWLFKANLDDPDSQALITKTTAAGEIVIADAVASVTVNASDTLALGEVQGFHELKRIDAGLEQILAHGTGLLQQGVHRS